MTLVAKGLENNEFEQLAINASRFVCDVFFLAPRLVFAYLRFGATQCSCELQGLCNSEASLVRVDGANKNPI
jgi:hypothetical protein